MSIKFAKPLDTDQEIKETEKLIVNLDRRINLMVLIAESLKTFQGNPITKKIITFLNKACPQYRFEFRSIAGMTYLHVFKDCDELENFFLAYHSDHVYDETKIFNQNNLIERKEDLVNYKKGLSKIPEYVNRYNLALTTLKELYEEAEYFGLGYNFDITVRERK